jgi:hypothetical protein
MTEPLAVLVRPPTTGCMRWQRLREEMCFAGYSMEMVTYHPAGHSYTVQGSEMNSLSHWQDAWGSLRLD